MIKITYSLEKALVCKTVCLCAVLLPSSLNKQNDIELRTYLNFEV
jgi:hypothetical protein